MKKNDLIEMEKEKGDENERSSMHAHVNRRHNDLIFVTSASVFSCVKFMQFVTDARMIKKRVALSTTQHC